MGKVMLFFLAYLLFLWVLFEMIPRPKPAPKAPAKSAQGFFYTCNYRGATIRWHDATKTELLCGTQLRFAASN